MTLHKKRRRMAATDDNLDQADDQPSVEEAEVDEVKHLGHRFVLLYGPWLRRK